MQEQDHLTIAKPPATGLSANISHYGNIFEPIFQFQNVSEFHYMIFTYGNKYPSEMSPNEVESDLLLPLKGLTSLRAELNCPPSRVAHCFEEA